MSFPLPFHAAPRRWRAGGAATGAVPSAAHLFVSLLFAASGLAFAQQPPGADAAESCTRLSTHGLPQARIVSAEWVTQGSPITLWPGAQATPAPRAFCRVNVQAAPVPGSAIGIEVWLPQTGDWNGKALQVGNGGFAGQVPVAGLHEYLLRGYAVAGTDGGHRAPDGMDASWALRQPQRVVDFGWRAVRETSRLSGRIVQRFMTRPPVRRYFVGCSNGGRDALMAAQRFPRDFDGVIAGAAAADWTGLMIGQALLQRDLLPPRAVLPASKLPALQAASRRACADGADYVRDPEACRVDPLQMLCRSGDAADRPDCLSPEQALLVRRIYAGMPEPVTGRWLPGLEPGTEADPGHWDFSLLAAPTQPLGKLSSYSFAEGFFRYFVRDDPNVPLHELITDDFARAQRRWHRDLDAVDPDLRAFRARGGKLLQYHGWADSIVPPRMSIAYQRSLRERMGQLEDFHRLYMVPGMNHCAGGHGPWQVDWLAALERWVEHGEAPAQLTARHPQTPATQMLLPHAAR